MKAAVIILLLLPALAIAEPWLLAEPTDTGADYYVVEIDGQGATVSPTLDALFYDLLDLEAGDHTVSISAGSWEFGDGEAVTFNLSKTINPQWIFLIISYDDTDADRFGVVKLKLRR